MDPYARMIDQPGFARRHTLESIFLDHLRESMRLPEEPERWDELYVVEDLAVVYASLRRVYMNLSDGTFVNVTNPRPRLTVMEATPTGRKPKTWFPKYSYGSDDPLVGNRFPFLSEDELVEAL